MTGFAELFLGFAIIGGITAVIVGFAVVLGRKESAAASVQADALVEESLRRAS